MDGLILRINYDFLLSLQKYEIKVNWIRTKDIPKNPAETRSTHRTFDSGSSYVNHIKGIALHREYLCYAGPFSVIQSLEMDNTNLRFENKYRWYDIFGEKRLVSLSDFDSYREQKHSEEIERYRSATSQLIDTYIATVNRAIAARLEAYVDPCYVDANYVSPHADQSIDYSF